MAKCREKLDEGPNTENESPRARDVRLNTENERPKIKGGRPKAVDERPKMRDERPKTDDERPREGVVRPNSITGNRGDHENERGWWGRRSWIETGSHLEGNNVGNEDRKAIPLIFDGCALSLGIHL